MPKNNSKTQNPNSKILIVEDSEIQAVMLKRLLTEKGYNVVWAKNGAEGLQMAEKERPNLIISDILMPVMDGYQMCKELKGNDALKGIPIILLTQLTDIKEIIKGLNSGAEFYITKPYDNDHILSSAVFILENPVLFKNRPEEKSTEVLYKGKKYKISANRGQTLTLLLSTYESAIMKNKKLIKIEEALKRLNEQLEQRVMLRTAELNKEVEERKQAEKFLMESEERYRVLTETANDAIVCINEKDAIYIWNKKAVEIFGYTAAEAIGKELHKLIVPENLREKSEKGLKEFFKTGEGNITKKTVELTAIKKEGAEFPIELSVSAMNVKGEWHATGIIRDITERKRLENELKDKLDIVERFNKLMVGRELELGHRKELIKKLEARVEELEKKVADYKAQVK
ncbi:MAG: hypothetical protein A2073_07710 [Deltaproteobacteria bacterium GWC2_42_11]|nr:MAG: hypothetical protein A2073_07710 [Deltaproteobacteria bacterium GWC2_42_11]